MLKVPGKLDSEDKTRVEECVRLYARPEIARREWPYVKQHIRRCISRLRNREPEWPADVGILAAAIYEVVNSGIPGQQELKPVSIRFLCGALFYLCKPDDVVPDYTPSVGYYDDAYALNYAIKAVKRIDPKGYRKIVSVHEKMQQA